MRSLSPLELIGAHRWKRATFTSYALSATFVEAVIVERLMRGGATEITILVDPLGYRMALRERGAVRIGREYVVHPVAVSNGCFHPKIMVLEADDAVHATVGSGNLTFGGWSANLECIEHLHDGGSALALGDLGGFFGALADSRGCEHDAREACRSLGNRLATAAARGSDDGRLRVSHSLERPIVDAVAQAAASMGRVERVTLASPYWDATAVDAIGERFGVESCGAHVPVARVPAPTGMDWPRAARRAMPVRIEALTQGEGVSRPLHAKMLEVACAGGRVTVAGSANATTAGLMSGGPTMRNVEVCAIRAVQGRSVRWKLGKAAAPPKPSAVLEEDADGDADVAVLVAEHDAGGISGRVITSWRSRSASASVEAGGRSFTLGTIEIGKDDDFTILPERLDAELSLEGRVQLRLDAQNETAEGFVASLGFGTIRARAGSALASMLAVIRDMQTPEDVAAIMEWVRANPRALGAPMQFRSGGVRSGDRDDPLVDAARVPETSRRGQQDGGGAAQGEGGRADHDWQQFVGRLLGATARARPREEEQADDEEPAEARRRSRARSAAEKLSLRFPAIFQKLEGDVRSDVELVNLLGLTSFVCVTTSHPMAAIFVQRLATIAERLELGPVARDVLAWCLVYLAAGASTLEASTTRARMLLLGIDPSRDPDPELALPALADLVAPAADVPGTFEAIRRIRTVHEDVRALQDALGAGAVPADLDALGFHPRWRAIVGECGREPERRRIHFVEVPRDACPKCNIALLPHLRSELRRVGVCESACHGFILARNPPCPTR